MVIDHFMGLESPHHVFSVLSTPINGRIVSICEVIDSLHTLRIKILHFLILSDARHEILSQIVAATILIHNVFFGMTSPPPC